MPSLIGTYVTTEEYKSSLEGCLSRELSSSTDVLVLIPFSGANRMCAPSVSIVNGAVDVLVKLGHKATVAYNPESVPEIDMGLNKSDINTIDLTNEHFIFSKGIGDRKEFSRAMPEKIKHALIQTVAVSECSFEAEAILPILSPVSSASFTIAGAIYSFLSVLPSSTIGRVLLEAVNGKHGLALSEIYSLFAFKTIGVVYDLHKYFDFVYGKIQEKNSDYIVFAQDCVAGDAYICELFGWPPLLSSTTRASSKLSTGDPFFSDVNFENKLPKGSLKVKRPITDRSQLIYPFNLFTKFKILVDNNKCDFCGICQRYCPNGSLSILNKDIDFTKQCVSCFFCVDSCPKHAMTIKRLP